MTFIEWLAIAFWPMSSALAIFLIWLWRRMWPARPNLFVLVALSVFILLTALLFLVIGNQSAAAVFDVDVYGILWGSLFLCVLFGARRSLKGAKGIFAGGVLLVFGLLMLGTGSRDLIGDFVLRRHVVDGTVDDVHYSESRHSGRHYHVVVNGQRYPTTADVFTQLRKGDHIRAEVGVGSGTMFRAAPL